MMRLFLILILTGLLGPTAAAQDEPETRLVHILNADSVIGEILDGEQVRHLIGNVHLLQDSTDLRSRRATQFLERDVIVFEGNVSIADPGDTLRADRVSYESALRIGRARGNVRLSDAEAVLYSDSLIYFRNERRAVFEAPVRLIERDGDAVLTSREGEYFTDQKVAFFREDVRLVDSTSVLTSDVGRYGTEDKRADFSGDARLTHEELTRIRSDSLTHHRDTRISVARGNVAVLRFGEQGENEAAPDTTRRTLLFGGYAYHDENAAYSRVERGGQHVDPLVARLTTDTLGVTDTLLVRAVLFEVTQPDSLDAGPLPEGASLQRIFGRGDVHLAGERIAAVADSAVVDRMEWEEEQGQESPPEEDIRLFRQPFAWLNTRDSELYTQISGDTLRVLTRNEAVDSLFAIGSAFAIRPDSLLDRNNQIKGRQMLALFEEDEIERIHVWPNAEAIYFRPDSLDQLEGGTQVSSDSMTFYFRDEDIERINVSSNLEGAYYEADILPSPFSLDGPTFQPERRPTTRDLLDGRPPLVDPFTLPPPPILIEAPPPFEDREDLDDIDDLDEEEEFDPDEDRFPDISLPEQSPPETSLPENGRDDP